MNRATLTETRIKSLRPKYKPYKVSDGTIGGLHVAVSVAGGKVFCLAYRFDGKWRLLRLGTWPVFSLEEARDLARNAKKQLATGTNPAAARKAERNKIRAEETTFRMVAAQWLAWREPVVGLVTTDDAVKRLEKHILPSLGDIPIANVSKADIKVILDILQAQGKYPTLRKVRITISQILRYAIDQEMPGVNVDWTTQLHRQYVDSGSWEKHRAAITTPKEIAGLMRAIDAYRESSQLTHLALRFSALTFCRPGEIRHAEWSEIDWQEKLWRIPAEKMKMRQPHLVPLAEQALDVLRELMPMTGHRYVKKDIPDSKYVNNGPKQVKLTDLYNFGVVDYDAFKKAALEVAPRKYDQYGDSILRGILHGRNIKTTANMIYRAYRAMKYIDDDALRKRYRSGEFYYKIKLFND